MAEGQVLLESNESEVKLGLMRTNYRVLRNEELVKDIEKSLEDIVELENVFREDLRKGNLNDRQSYFILVAFPTIRQLIVEKKTIVGEAKREETWFNRLPETRETGLSQALILQENPNFLDDLAIYTLEELQENDSAIHLILDCIYGLTNVSVSMHGKLLELLTQKKQYQEYKEITDKKPSKIPDLTS